MSQKEIDWAKQLSVATCQNMKKVKKTAPRERRGSKYAKHGKTSLGSKKIVDKKYKLFVNKFFFQNPFFVLGHFASLVQI